MSPSAEDLPVLESLPLRPLDVPEGGAARIDVRVPVADLVLGGQSYTCVPPAPAMRVDASRAIGGGWYFRLRGACDLHGPCWRCLSDATVPLVLDAAEIDDPGSDDPQMRSLYLRNAVLHVAEWARDAAAEAIPPTILCREDCAGLCPQCGTDLNAGACACGPPPPDNRWAGLAELAERLRAQEE
ncbi:MAG TPA: DUF177 domain-containing protein [Miltoncostaeaceae bacterium]|nr:DUF177 domain-containing protein [Miltoncostaeaceae bacterium]